MKNIKISKIIIAVKKLLVEASFFLPQDILSSIKSAVQVEESASAKAILEMIIENAGLAAKNYIPLCQDCGTVYININIGPGICIAGEDKPAKNINDSLYEYLNKAVSEVYEKYYLRKSIVFDPLFERKNTGSNTPVILNACFSNEPGLKVELCLKGGGSENCSWLYMLNPSAKEDLLVEIILELVRSNATKACPPLIIGIGLGSTASEVTKLARKAAFRNLNVSNTDKRYALLEAKLLEAINKTGIGPQGIGGKTTALACNIEFAPCHMATLPFAVFFNCHSNRKAACKII